LALRGRGVAGALYDGVLAVASNQLRKGENKAPEGALSFGFLSGEWYTRRLDIAELPRQQDAYEQQDRKAHPERQGARHVAGLGLAVPAVPHHEEERGAQAADDGHERQEHQVFHDSDYPVSRLRSTRFWLVSLAAVAGVAATSALGAWQLGRAQERLALQASIDARKALPPVGNQALLGAVRLADLMHRPVVLRGAWLARHTIYLDNRQMRGTPGFYVVTPLRLEGSGWAVLV